MGIETTDHRFDDEQFATSDFHGRFIADRLERFGIKLRTGAIYLALGAGYAEGEMAFAQELGISTDPSHMILVDMKLPDGLIGIKRDIETFLSEEPVPKYNLVTAFGMGYRLDDNLELLLNKLRPHLANEAIIVVFPYSGPDVKVENFEPKALSDLQGLGKAVCYQYIS